MGNDVGHALGLPWRVTPGTLASKRALRTGEGDGARGGADGGEETGHADGEFG
jgi:hypothetical protein